jgi:hypothetical protein
MMITVLYDGWALVRQPNSPAALHLAALLAYRPPEVQAILALPGSPPAWLPQDVSVHLQPVPDTDFARLRWEQRTLPRLTRELGAGLLHLVSAGPALFGSVPTVISSIGDGTGREGPGEPGRTAGLAARLRHALAQGGMERVRAVLWPEDLPPPEQPARILRLPPLVPPSFWDFSGGSKPASLSGLDLPETYILSHGPFPPRALRRLLDAWSWASGSIGDYYPLLILGLDEASRNMLAGWLVEYQLEDSVRSLPVLPPDGIAALYRGCSAILHPAPVSGWGEPLRMGLVSQKPVVALESPLADALVGPAAYLVPRGDTDLATGRLLGAALITVIVEESIAEQLSKAARLRAARWRDVGFAQRLLAAYQSVLSPPSKDLPAFQ